MPFRVTLTRGCKYGLITTAAVASEDEMGRPIDPQSSVAMAAAMRNQVEALRWRRHLKYGDMVRIQGAFFRVITGDELLSAYDESKEVDSEKMSFTARDGDEAAGSEAAAGSSKRGGESSKTAGAEDMDDDESEEEGTKYTCIHISIHTCEFNFLCRERRASVSLQEGAPSHKWNLLRPRRGRHLAAGSHRLVH